MMDEAQMARPAGAHERWVVVGAGATGAWIALQGAKLGKQVTLVDKDQTMGGLTATQHLTVDDHDVEIDRFYHVILESDHRVRALLDELALAQTVRWTAAPAEIIKGGTRYPATSLGEMATLPMLKRVDRARIGMSIGASLALPMSMANRVTSSQWLSRVAGRSAMDAFWTPILRAKLGTAHDQVSATFMVSTFRRLVQARLQGSGDKFGVLPHGYRPVFEALRARLEELGGELRFGSAVERVEKVAEGGLRVSLANGETLDADRCFVTTAGPITTRVVDSLTPDEKERLAAAPYLGVLCGSFLLDEAPNPCYITYLIDDVDLTGVIGMHALLGTDQTAGKHLVYLPHYCAADDPWFDLPDEEVERRLLDGLRACFPNQDIHVAAGAINRARYVVPLPMPHAVEPLGFTTSVPGVHIVSTAQTTTGTLNVEGSFEMADKALAEIGPSAEASQKPDTILFLGPGWHSFEQLCAAAGRRGVRTQWIGYPATTFNRLRTSLFTPMCSVDNPQALREKVLELGPERVMEVVLPEFLVAELAPVLLELPLPEAVKDNLRIKLAWLDKQQAMDALVAAGLPTPRHARTPDLTTAVAEVGLPLVVKGTVGGGGSAVRICRSEQEAARAIKELGAEGELFIEQFCDGDDGLCYGAIVRDGRLVADLTYRGERTRPDTYEVGPFDSLRIVDDPELLEVGRRAAELVGGDGAIGIDAIRDHSGQLFLIDVNVRPFGPMVTLEEADAGLLDAYLAVLKGEQAGTTHPTPDAPVPSFPGHAVADGCQNPLRGLVTFGRTARPHRKTLGPRYLAAEFARFCKTISTEARSGAPVPSPTPRATDDPTAH